MKKMKIGVLETGRPPQELAPQFGDYPGMVESWLADPDAEFATYAVLDGVLPSSPSECDLWIIPGSRFGVYEDHPWIAPLEDFIRRSRDAKRKMVGICFGHQIIAQALGGTVEKSPKGWGLGVHTYRPVQWPAQLAPAPQYIAIQAYHQDQVIVPPDSAVQIARSDFCEYGALWYPGFALTVQGHPEFSNAYTDALLESRRGTILSDEQVAAARASMEGETTRDALAVFIRSNFDTI